jgi:hypothetical protein
MILNAPHLHLVLNHAPLFGTLFGLGLLTYGLLYKSNHARIAGYAVLIIAALGTVPVYLSGSQSEDAIEKLPGVAKTLIDEHEDAATISLIVILAAGALAAISWFLDARRAKLSRAAAVVTFALGIVALASFGYTALLGGQIHHPEIRPGSASTDVSGDTR